MRYLAVLSLFILASFNICYAEDTVACTSTCPDGKVVVSYADGNNTTCVCEPAAEMDETVADPNADAEGSPEPAQNVE